MMVRLVSLSKQGEELWDHIGEPQLSSASPHHVISFADKMVDHVQERKKDVIEWSSVEERIINVVQKIFNEDDISETLLHKLYGIICTNSISIGDMICLYPILSMINHSCAANSVYTFNTETNSVILRAKRNIEAGEEITLCYTDPWDGQPSRKMKLMKTWFFECRSAPHHSSQLSAPCCRCPRCCDVTEFGTNISALKCSSCREGLVLPETCQAGNVLQSLSSDLKSSRHSRQHLEMPILLQPSRLCTRDQ